MDNGESNETGAKLASESESMAAIHSAPKVRRARRREATMTRRERDSIYAGMGMEKVRGGLGGIYYE